MHYIRYVNSGKNCRDAQKNMLCIARRASRSKTLEGLLKQDKAIRIVAGNGREMEL